MEIHEFLVLLDHSIEPRDLLHGDVHVAPEKLGSTDLIERGLALPTPNVFPRLEDQVLDVRALAISKSRLALSITHNHTR
jgi:hypothetical protein